MEVRHQPWRHQSNCRPRPRKPLNFFLNREPFLLLARGALLSWLLLFLDGCATPETRWAEVERSTNAYEKQARAGDLDASAEILRGFVHTYPKSVHAQEAQERL